MTREEAIDILENEKMCVNNETCQREECATCSLVMDKDKILTALDMALSALRPVSREQVEKVWRGEWTGNFNAHCSLCDAFNTMAYIGQGGNFCPSCGAPMTDEAVEMVMERMEALHENIHNGWTGYFGFA